MPRVHVTPAFWGFFLFWAIMAGRQLRGKSFSEPVDLPVTSSDPESLLAFATALENLSPERTPMAWPWVLLGGLGVGAVYALSILAHELGHYFTARRLGVAVDGITLNAAGGFVELTDDSRLTRRGFAVIIAAGPLVTALLAAGAYLLYRVELPYSPAGEVADHMINVALLVNVVALVVNLLPFPGLDGWQLLRTARMRRYAA
jgi:Zn-dependent protease